MKELTPEEFDAKVALDTLTTGGTAVPVKMTRRCTGCGRAVHSTEVKCCHAFYDSSAGPRRTGKKKLSKKERRYLKKVVETAVAERAAGV